MFNNPSQKDLDESISALNIRRLLDALQHGADVRKKNEAGRAPLHLAAEIGARFLSSILIHRGADINVLDLKGNSPVMVALQSSKTIAGVEDFIELMAYYGADFSIANSDGDTAKDLAAGNEAMSTLLTRLSASDVSLRRHSVSDAENAIAHGEEDRFLSEILPTLKTIQLPSFWNDTLLHYASLLGEARIVQSLLSDVRFQCDLSAKDKCGLTPLHRAAKGGDLATVKLLVEASSAELAAQDKWKKTPLHWAAHSGHEDVSKFLLSKSKELGFSVEHENVFGATPSQLANAHGIHLAANDERAKEASLPKKRNG